MKGALLLAGLAAVAACGDGAVSPRSGPSIAFDATTHDFGAVDAGTELRHSFEIHNRGERPLHIDALRPGCGCRANDGRLGPIAPHGRLTIGLACDTSGLTGPQRRTVAVYANDPAQPVTMLVLEARVQTAIAAVPASFYFGRARAGRPTERDIRLLLQDPDAAPRRAGSEQGLFSAGLDRRSEAEWRVSLTVSPEAPAGVVRDRLVIETGSATTPKLVVPVTGVVESEP